MAKKINSDLIKNIKNYNIFLYFYYINGKKNP